jgi:hypothetical protein
VPDNSKIHTGSPRISRSNVERLTSMPNFVTFGGKWQVLPELPGRFDGIIWQGDRRGGRMVDGLERMLEIDLWLLRWCKVDGFVRCSVGGAGAAPL